MTLCLYDVYIYRIFWDSQFMQSGKPSSIRESNQASDVRKAHYAYHYVRKSSILLARTGFRTISSVACGFNPIKIQFSDCPKSLIS